MKSSGFQFKQFYIEHSGCAMKVGTDSIMLGSWINVDTAQHILDIGTGSGVLAIMLAQKSSSDCHVWGVDIDAKAIQQAKVNADLCPWGNRITLVHSRLQEYPSDTLYDLIVSNPPYFATNQTANLSSNANSRIIARQTTELTHADLLSFVAKKLSVEGQFCCVIPADVTNKFVDLATKFGLYCLRSMAVTSKPDGKVIRYLYQFSKSQQALSLTSINIHNVDGSYSADYKSLCKDYYLNF